MGQLWDMWGMWGVYVCVAVFACVVVDGDRGWRWYSRARKWQVVTTGVLGSVDSKSRDAKASAAQCAGSRVTSCEVARGRAMSCR